MADPSITGRKVLCVGAGGIGCELLKTLVLTGFNDIEVIDMDTIETSNLNRQFLFRRHHVGMSKAQVAVESVTKFRPAAKLTAHHCNIKDAQFGVDFFKRFAVVLNGLDNLEARKHVNRLCLAADVPLVESGTQGYLGQVTVHVKGHSECFECQPKALPKSFPVCTLRNHPDRPIHCVVWAKDMLFPRLFGKKEEVTDLDEGQDETSFFVRKEGEESKVYAERIFRRLFQADIDALIRMETLWEKRQPPTVHDLTSLVPSDAAPPDACASIASTSLGLTDTHKVWSVEESARVFLTAVQRFLDTRADEMGSATFDKDDDLAVDFVTAASNLRAGNFGIADGQQTWFATKGMAGNIIHAIATTNAIISGLIVIEACKLLSGQVEKTRDTFCVQHPSARGKMLVPVEPQPPNAKCFVCSQARLTLEVDTSKMTLGTLIDKVLKPAMGVNKPIITTAGDFSYDDADEDSAAVNALNRPKALRDLPGGGLGEQMTVEDDTQEFSVVLIVRHSTDFAEEDDPTTSYRLKGDVPTATAREAADGAPEEKGGDTDDAFVVEEDELMIVEQAPAAKKRKRTEDQPEEAVA